MTIVNGALSRKRLVADRFRRIHALLTMIADEPGHSRRELSDLFHLSERQVQADLNIIRSDMQMPLVRRQGYRFADEGMAGQPFSLQEVWRIAMAIKAQGREGASHRSILEKMPTMVAAHLRPTVAQGINSLLSPRPTVIGRVIETLVAEGWVRLYGLEGPVAEPTVKPEIVMWYVGGWYVIGECKERSSRGAMMFRIDAATAATRVTP